MQRNAIGPTAIDGKKRERNDRRSQNDVRHEHGEVHATDPALVGEMNRADLGVMKEIGDEEQRR